MPRKAPAKRGRSIAFFTVAGDTYVRLAIPLLPPLPKQITAAERELIPLLLEGNSNAEIAAARGVAVRTVANQVASILKKVGVGSRSALIARLTRDSLSD